MIEKLKFYREYSAAAEKVWKAITDKEALSEWLMEADFAALESAEYEMSEPGLKVWGKVLEVVENRKLSYLWVSARDDEEGEAGIASVLTWTLTPTEAGGTAVLLEHQLLEEQKPVVTIEAAVNWSYAIHSSLASYLSGHHVQPVPIVYAQEDLTAPSEGALERAGFRQPAEVLA